MRVHDGMQRRLRLKLRRRCRSPSRILCSVVLLCCALPTAHLLIGIGALWATGSDPLCSRSYAADHKWRRRVHWFLPRGLSPSAVHNHRAAWMRQLGICGGQPTVDCRSFGGLLEGVDMYVIETPKRTGMVRAQAQRYGIHPEHIAHVAATTPESIPDCNRVSALCAKRSRKEYRTLLRPWPLRPEEVAVTVSHLAAAKLACSRPGRSDVTLVMEDDANLEALEHWPASLKAMLATLPPQWQIVNAAPSNIQDAFAPSFFARARIAEDYGAIGVIWNTSQGSPVCERLVMRAQNMYVNISHAWFLNDGFHGNRRLPTRSRSSTQQQSRANQRTRFSTATWGARSWRTCHCSTSARCGGEL